MSPAETVFIYDTTLRDGAQREGISLSLNDKLKIARRLDAFGVHYIEGGWPGSNPKDAEFFRAVRELPLHHAKVAAFGATRHKESDVEEDANLQALLEAETPVVTLVGKSWTLHVHDVLGASLDENVQMIAESVAYLKSRGKEVIYDAEHFFDGFKDNPRYTLRTLQAAAEAGADAIVLCDTNGGSLPWEIEETTARVAAELADVETTLGIHTHDDGGCGVANSLAAVRAGARHVQGTINGYGERVGNANLCTIVPDLQLKMGYDCIPPERLAELAELARYVAEVANLPPDSHQPFVGASAFAHKGGIHVAAMRKNEASYQHVEPHLVGNQKRTVISELAGRGNVLDKAAEYGLDLNSTQAREIVQEIKELEAAGFAFESAEASLALMLRRLQPDYEAPFTLLDYMVVVNHRPGRSSLADATVKVRVGDRTLHTAAEGNGPVNALDGALRKALVGVYPALAGVRLRDYKVRILDSDSATAASVRVLIDTENGQRRWSTVGASTNIIEASWRALADSMEFALLDQPYVETVVPARASAPQIP